MGIIPTMENGEILDNDKQRNAFGVIGAKVIENNLNILECCGSPVHLGSNLLIDAFFDTASIDLGSSNMIVSAGSNIFLGSVYDDFQDASIDGTKWSTNHNFIESGGSLYYDSGTFQSSTVTASIIADGTDNLNAKNVSGNYEIMMHFGTSLRKGNDAGDLVHASILVTDGTSEVILRTYEVLSGEVSTSDEIVNLVFDGPGSLVDVYVNGSPTNLNVDVSTVSGDWNIMFAGRATEDDGTDFGRLAMFVRAIGFVDGSGGVASMVSTAQTHSSTVEAVIPWASLESRGNEFLIEASANGGVDYTPVKESQLGSITVSGTSVRAKIIGSLPSSILSTSINIGEIKGYGVLY